MDGIRLALGVILVVAAMLKLARPEATAKFIARVLGRDSLEDSRLLTWLTRILGTIEIVVAVVLTTASGWSTWVAAVLTATMFFAFTVVNELARRRKLACGCFGPLSRKQTAFVDVARLVGCTGGAIAVLAATPLDGAKAVQISAVTALVSFSVLFGFGSLMVSSIVLTELAGIRKAQFSLKTLRGESAERVSRRDIIRALFRRLSRRVDKTFIEVEKRSGEDLELIARAQSDVGVQHLGEIVAERFSCQLNWEAAVAYQLTSDVSGGQPAPALEVPLDCPGGILAWIPMEAMGGALAIITVIIDDEPEVLIAHGGQVMEEVPPMMKSLLEGAAREVASSRESVVVS